MSFTTRLAWLLIATIGCQAHAQHRTLLSQPTHLRSGSEQEWVSFPADCEHQYWEVEFEAETNPLAQLLAIRHDDVKQGWQVLLNGKRVGRFPPDENAMTSVFEIDPQSLISGTNSLRIEPTGTRVDDVYFGPVLLHDQSPEKVLNQSILDVTVVNDQGRPLPCRLTILDSTAALAPLGNKSDARTAVRTGMVYTIDGRAKLNCTAGSYTVYANRGMEYSMAKASLQVAAGESKSVRLVIRRELNTKGYVSCDTHVHTFTYSRHGDATIDERMLTIAGEDIDLPIACDHNLQIDYSPHARRMKVEQYFTPVIGNEVTTKIGHFNVFPLTTTAPPPNYKAADWPAIFASIYSAPQAKIAILNHGRDIHGGYRPFAPGHHLSLVGANVHDWKLQANAMELLNSAALQTDPMNLYRDWFGLLNAGKQITPIGSSDSHEVSRKLVGQGRTFIRCPDGDRANIDVAQAVENMLAGKVIVSLGLFPQITVDNHYREGDLAKVGEQIEVAVSVQSPSWLRADKVQLFANGVLIRSETLSAEDKLTQKVAWQLPKPKHDVFLVAIATGPGIDELYWRIAKSYQPTSKIWKSYVMGSTGAVWIDADGDQQKTTAKDYAVKLVSAADGDFDKLVSAMQESDEAIAAQVAHLLQTKGENILTGRFVEAVNRAGSQRVKTGVSQYVSQWRTAQQASP